MAQDVAETVCSKFNAQVDRLGDRVAMRFRGEDGAWQDVTWGEYGRAVRETALAIGRHKAALGVTEALALGVLCNGLVCLAVWLAMGGRSVADKVLAIVFPITAFVTMGFEHSIANLFFLPYALALSGFGDAQLVAGSVRNLLVVTGGNILGGTVLVAGVYWVAYLRTGAG